MTGAEIIVGDCLDVLKTFESNTFDAMITDPPAGIGFMNKDWDHDKGGRQAWVLWLSDVLSECNRVLKPGAHALVWSIPRTSHWTGTACELAGFEVRDVVCHLFGTGFPKSMNVGKAIPDGEWDGWGTALKPAAEFWWLIRKPLEEKTVAANVLKYGTGALNIDASRVSTDESTIRPCGPSSDHARQFAGTQGGTRGRDAGTGRWPANVVHDGSECVVDLFPETKSGAISPNHKCRGIEHIGTFKIRDRSGMYDIPASSGSASRFFYCAKPSTKERNEGICNQVTTVDDGRQTPIDNPYLRGETERRNTHPTCKSIELMRHFVKLVTPPGGMVLDPFAGSGSTLIAAQIEGFESVGIEQSEEYASIARQRIAYWKP